METNFEGSTKVFKAFCDEKRLNILKLLQNGEKCACSLLEELNIGQSTLSHHMRILCESGVVVARREGKWSYYSIDEQGVIRAKMLLDEFTRVNLVSIDKCNK